MPGITTAAWTAGHRGSRIIEPPSPPSSAASTRGGTATDTIFFVTFFLSLFFVLQVSSTDGQIDKSIGLLVLDLLPGHVFEPLRQRNQLRDYLSLRTVGF